MRAVDPEVAMQEVDCIAFRLVNDLAHNNACIVTQDASSLHAKRNSVSLKSILIIIAVVVALSALYPAWNSAHISNVVCMMMTLINFNASHQVNVVIEDVLEG